MSRSQPYRSKMPVEIIRVMDVASRITLFLVGQSGPLCFTFKDRLDNKFKTSIGADLKCSCSPNRHDHCMHTLYVMLKIFKVSPQNPIIWQAAYVDSELTDLLSGKYTVITNRSRLMRPSFLEEESSYELPSDFLERRKREKEQAWINISSEAKAERMKINEESVCPICQQVMSEDMCLTYCKVKCGNNFHTQCLKIWAEHKKTTQTEITCPMCRSAMGSNILKQINILQREYKKAELEKIKIKYKCSSCGVTDIPKNVYKCILCKSFELCEACYAANKHIKHPFIKQSCQDGRWRGAQERRESELKIKKFVDNRRRQKNMNEILLEKLRKVEEDPAKLLDFVASSYPYVSKYISQNLDPYKKLDFNPEDMKCMKCNAKKMIFLRRLTCGHFIDHECLKQNIRKERFYCDECGAKILKGYQNLVELEKENNNKKEREGIRLQMNEQFNPSKMEESDHHFQASQDDYNFVLPEEATLHDILGQVRQQFQEEPTNRMRHRISRNIVQEPQTYHHRNNHAYQQQRHTRMLSHNIPHPNSNQIRKREADKEMNNNIRIRNVGRSIATNNSQKRNISHDSRKNVRHKQDLGLMIEAMIGRKVF